MCRLHVILIVRLDMNTVSWGKMLRDNEANCCLETGNISRLKETSGFLRHDSPSFNDSDRFREDNTRLRSTMTVAFEVTVIAPTKLNFYLTASAAFKLAASAARIFAITL